MQLIVEITHRCPAKCRFCTVPKDNVDMPLVPYMGLLALFTGVYPKLSLVISGGEPSVVENLEAYVLIAKKMGHTVTIATNGFYPERIAKTDADCVEVSVDYWGKRQDENRGVEGLWKNITWLLDNSENTIIRSTLLPDNLDDLRKVRKRWPEKPMIVMPARGADAPRIPQEVIEEVARWPNTLVADNCPAGISSVVASPLPDGSIEILACIFYRKRLGVLRAFTKEELMAALEAGRKIPRFPCMQR